MQLMKNIIELREAIGRGGYAAGAARLPPHDSGPLYCCFGGFPETLGCERSRVRRSRASRHTTPRRGHSIGSSGRVVGPTDHVDSRKSVYLLSVRGTNRLALLGQTRKSACQPQSAGSMMGVPELRVRPGAAACISIAQLGQSGRLRSCYDRPPQTASIARGS